MSYYRVIGEYLMGEWTCVDHLTSLYSCLISPLFRTFQTDPPFVIASLGPIMFDPTSKSSRCNHGRLPGSPDQGFRFRIIFIFAFASSHR
jgi:hypothetical protein